MTKTDSDNYAYSSLMLLEVNYISLATGYEFKWEDQAIYLSKDLYEFTPRRRWPEITLPVPAAVPPQPAPLGPNTQLIRAMQATHMHYQFTRGSIQSQLGNMFVHTVTMHTFPNPN